MARRQVDPGLDPVRTARWLCGLIDALYFQAADPAFDPVRDTEMMLLIVSRALQPAADRRSGAAT